MMYKLRHIVNSSAHRQETFGITIPGEVVLFFKIGTYFKVSHSGTSIILESGANYKLDSNQLKEYRFEDCLA